MATEEYQTAIWDFYQARRQANLEKSLSFLTGKSAELLSFNEVVKTLKITGFSLRKLQEIPLDKIVGSVGRYADFSRRFLPKRNSDKVRWSRVKSLVTGLRGAPPIEVYQIDEVISKGQANYEIMSEIQGVYFLLIAKCPIVANDTGTYKGALILYTS